MMDMRIIEEARATLGWVRRIGQARREATDAAVELLITHAERSPPSQREALLVAAREILLSAIESTPSA